uniref:Wsv415-like protein n=1 Tax=Sicyonia whispovirus TaxID=2984283 RepID=A0A9C7C0A1_9VIRU|nr:MAG: wsv415-like protein [Sicyonia whispovirus]
MHSLLHSLHSLERGHNDAARRSAACEAAAVTLAEGTEYLEWEPPTHKLGGPRYAVLAPDPCEDPEDVYVDVVVNIAPSALELAPAWSTVAESLWDLSPWTNFTPDDDSVPRRLAAASVTAEASRARRDSAMGTLTFTGRSDPVAVGMPRWQETRSHFARRLSLKCLCDLLSDSGVVTSKDALFQSIFEKPLEVATASGVEGLANRGQFSKEGMVEWFFTFDTYSKCVVFYEAVTRFLESQASPLSLALDDVYCAVFTRIERRSYVTRISPEGLSVEHALAPSGDVRLADATEAVSDFLLRNLNTSHIRGPPGAAGVPLKTLGSLNRAKILVKHKMGEEKARRAEGVRDAGISLEGSIGRNTATKRSGIESSPLPYRAGLIKRSRLDEPEPLSLTVTADCQGKATAAVIWVRRYPILPGPHNQLLFPVFSVPDACSGSRRVLHFLQLGKLAAASLLLPGVLRNDKLYASGECPWMESRSRLLGVPLAPSSWRYSLADYSPLKYFPGRIQRRTGPCSNTSDSTERRHLSVRPLFF